MLINECRGPSVRDAVIHSQIQVSCGLVVVRFLTRPSVDEKGSAI
jgi:hypothetical protein